MHPATYSVTLKNSPKSGIKHKDEHLNYIVIKEHNYKFKKIIKGRNPITFDLLKNQPSEPSQKTLLTFKIEESQVKDFSHYLERKQEDFLKENNINKESIKNFLKFLEADETYSFTSLEVNENLNKQSFTEELSAHKMNDGAVLSQDFLDAERKNLQNNVHISSLNRSNSLVDTKLENETLRRTLSLHSDLGNKEPFSIERPESLASSQDSTENGFENLELNTDPLVQKENTFSISQELTETLQNIEKHKLAIEKGYFNGLEKSVYLSSISGTAREIESNSRDLLNNSLIKVDVEKLKRDIHDLKEYINNKETTDILSRYRGFSPFKCFATLWGGGKVKSIEYVNQLQDQLKTLTEEISSIRPAI